MPELVDYAGRFELLEEAPDSPARIAEELVWWRLDVAAPTHVPCACAEWSQLERLR
jgi:hypothetical protein